MTIDTRGTELTFVRNVHTPRGPGEIGFEYTPPSEQGAQEEIVAAGYLREHMGDRAVTFFYSPFASRSRTTSIGIMKELDEIAVSPPVAHALFVPHSVQAEIDASTKIGEVADAEIQAVENLKYYLEAFQGQMTNTFPVVVMSGLAILQYFTGGERYSRGLVNRVVPTGAVIHEGRDRFRGFVPHGHNAEALAKYLEETRLRKSYANRR